MKTNLTKLLALSLVSGGLVVSCNTASNSIKESKTSEKENTTQSLIIKEDKKNTLQKVTSFSLLSSFNNISSLKTLDKDLPLSESDKEDLLKVLPSLDLMFQNDSFTSTILEETNVFNNVTYTYKEVISYKDTDNLTSTITLLYNASVIKERIDNEDNEKETIQELKGVSFLNNTETYYEFTSFYKVEEEGNEKEEERKFKINLSANSYILVEETYEEGEKEVEKEFEYTLVQNNQRILEYSISIENEHGLDKISYELNNKEYELTLIKNGYQNIQDLYVVEYEIEEVSEEREGKLYFIKNNGNFEEVTLH